ncbi:DegT/DnrJ/EryC1/StrS family aminotransferase [Tautonia plasticadhaerens]|uniref:Aminotransferase n=1 Tax=Tautonia plasticadhaerens TaxID=2527974 RepID=A0A518H4J0_9BACT|nr:DegT/DnrJ/EryC1/StrS family aminotransferase [Tautonia plasticadhaerens]QDV35756.1 Aminotransferase [Tautonia plasticadhaerens]
MTRPAETPSVPALDLKAQYRAIRDEVEPMILELMESQQFVLGANVAGLEEEVAAYCGASHAVGCASGTDALLLPLMAWGIGPGDEVITSPFTFFATAGVIWRLGARPVFVDIDPGSYNLDPSRLADAISPRTRAIIPVHLYGQAADMDPINAIAADRGLKVLEDAAQAIGAGYEGKRAGVLGHASAFSFYPSKNLGGFGDGGLITTEDAELASRMKRLRVHGMEPKYYHAEVGLNSRLDALQAAVLRIKLRHLDAWTAGRRALAESYRDLFEAAGLLGLVTLPTELPGRVHVYNQFVIRVDAELRDPLRARLSESQIGSEIYYPIPLHLQECFAPLGHKAGDFPASERAAGETIALPMYPELPTQAARRVVEAVAGFYRDRGLLPSRREHAA